MDILTGIPQYWLWLMLAGILLIIELILIPSGFLLFTAAAAVCTFIITWLFQSISTTYSLFLFATLAIASSLLWWRFIYKPRHQNTTEKLNARGEKLIGHQTTLQEPIINNKGRITINGSSWPITAQKNYTTGTKIEVTEIDGIILKVKAVE